MSKFLELFLYDKTKPLLFTMLYFWVFFLVVLTIYSFIYKKTALRNAFLFFVSLFFYYKTSGLFFLILLFTTITNFFIGKGIYKSVNLLKNKILIAISVILNLGVLIYFKYAYFFTDTFNRFFETDHEVINHLALWTNKTTGSHFEVSTILLPVGISFFTFQTISYIVDLYRKKAPPVKNMLDFGFYVSFFPQLVAGPILRASNFVPQLYKEFKLSKYDFGLAVFWILKGLFKKMFIGDYIATNFVDRVFENPLSYTGFENLLATFGYSLQVYVDFSGYTDIAIGIALLMGFRIPMNFNSPYKAQNVGDFWKRWHISLSSWLKDYLYIPMGGNRGGSPFTYIAITVILIFIVLLSGVLWLIPVFISVFLIFVVLGYFLPKFKLAVDNNINLLTTMLIGGLWHGASWQFVIWGGLNGVGLIVFKFWKKNIMSRWIFFGVINTSLAALWFTKAITLHTTLVLLVLLNVFWLISFITGLLSKWINSESRLLSVPNIVLTFSFITFTRIFFRSESMEVANNLMHQIRYDFQFTLIPEILHSYSAVFLIMLLGFVFHWLPTKWKDLYQNWFIKSPIYAKIIIAALVVFIIYQSISAELQPFIYFQF